MSFLYGKKDPLDVLPDQKQQSAVPTLQQNFDAAQQSAYVGDQSVSKGRLLQQQWEPLIEEINARNDGIPFPNPADVYLENALSGIVMPSMVESFYQQDADEIIKHINENPAIRVSETQEKENFDIFLGYKCETLIPRIRERGFHSWLRTVENRPINF